MARNDIQTESGTVTKTVETEFEFKETTPGTVKLWESGHKDSHKVGMLYVKKFACCTPDPDRPGEFYKPPKSVKVTMQFTY